MHNKMDEDLEFLDKKLIKMANFAENIISLSTNSFIKQNKELSKNAIDSDKNIDASEREIEKICMGLLIKRQPVAKDLRKISSILKIITDIEHIGDQASEIARLAIRMIKIYKAQNNQASKNKILEQNTLFSLKDQYAQNILEISKVVKFMVVNGIKAFVEKDLDLAISVIKDDDVADNAFNKTKKKVIESLQNDCKTCEKSIDVLMMAKYFERIGDHAANIANWVIFSITGLHKIDFEENDAASN